MSGRSIWFVIVNPTSGNGAGRRRWPAIKGLLESFGFDFDFVFTEYPGHSRKLVLAAAHEGHKRFICIGGDGTLHNIVNGIMMQRTCPSEEIRVGVIPVGTGNDWVKTHGVPRKHKDAIAAIKSGKFKTQDVGEIIMADSSRPSTYFINLAGVGFDGYVVSKVEKYKSLGALAYLMGAMLGLGSYKRFQATLKIGEDLIQDSMLMILAGIGRYSGGGMQLTRNPNPFDGLLDISVASSFSKLDVILNLGRLFNGRIVNHQKVTTIKSDEIRVTIQDRIKPYIQTDGELLEGGNFSIVLHPKRFSFYLP